MDLILFPGFLRFAFSPQYTPVKVCNGVNSTPCLTGEESEASELKRFGSGQVSELVGALSHTLKGCGCDSHSGHRPRLWVQSPVGACMGGNQSMLLSLPFPLPLSLKSINISLGED